MTNSDAQPAVGYRVLRALLARDFGAFATCFDEHVRFRALLPPGPREVNGAVEAAGCFRDWYGAADRLELLGGGVDPVGQRAHLSWRLRVHEPGRRRLIEQQAFATVRDDRIVALDLVCSGFQPEEPLADLQPPQPVAAPGPSASGSLGAKRATSELVCDVPKRTRSVESRSAAVTCVSAFTGRESWSRERGVDQAAAVSAILRRASSSSPDAPMVP